MISGAGCCCPGGHRELVVKACHVAVSRIDFTTSEPSLPDSTIDINAVPSTNRFASLRRVLCLLAPMMPPDPYGIWNERDFFQFEASTTKLVSHTWRIQSQYCAGRKRPEKILIYWQGKHQVKLFPNHLQKLSTCIHYFTGRSRSASPCPKASDETLQNKCESWATVIFSGDQVFPPPCFRKQISNIWKG